MVAVKKRTKPAYLQSILHHKCSRCRLGNMFLAKNSYDFRRFMKMNDKCPVCDQHMEIEIGFYYGTAYVSYSLTVALSVATFIAWWVLLGFSLNDNRIFWWMGLNTAALIIVQPYLMRMSRAIWLSFFVRYNANWANEKPIERERS